MTLTDEEAREIKEVIHLHGICWRCDESGRYVQWASTDKIADAVPCPYCEGKGNRYAHLITLLESRMDAGRKERG